MKKLAFVLVAVYLLFSGAVMAQDLPPAIIMFESDVVALSLPEVESGIAELTLNWTVVGLRDGDSLALESMTVGEWLALTGEPLNANGSVTFAVGHSGQFRPPSYRLVIRDADGQIVDAWVVSVPYAVDDDATPEITLFEAGDIMGGELPLRWEVVNRTPSSNLVFEQVLPDESTVSVERPRATRWIPSAGRGEVIPIDAEVITIRLSLLDVVSGEILDSAEITLQEPANSDASMINGLIVSQPNADYGDTVEVSWDVENAADITLTVTPRDRITVNLGVGLPETGTLTYTIPEDGHFNRVDFWLTAADSAGQSEDRLAFIYMNCEIPWFFDEPHGASNCSLQLGAEVDAAYQNFEGGMMLWRVDTNEIYVLGSDGRFEIFQDTWVQGEDFTSGEAPPEGLLAPVRGFGKVWAQQARVRDELGWATAPETSYRMQVQSEAAVYKAYFLYVTLPDGSILYLNMGTSLAPMGTWAALGG
jgi:hypothetical protein